MCASPPSTPHPLTWSPYPLLHRRSTHTPSPPRAHPHVCTAPLETCGSPPQKPLPATGTQTHMGVTRMHVHVHVHVYDKKHVHIHVQCTQYRHTCTCSESYMYIHNVTCTCIHVYTYNCTWPNYCNTRTYAACTYARTHAHIKSTSTRT